MKSKDIPDEPILNFLATMRGGYCGAGWHDLLPRADYSPTVLDAMPVGTPKKLALAKMRSLLRRGLVEGCGCGCRGDFVLSDEGRRALTSNV